MEPWVKLYPRSAFRFRFLQDLEVWNAHVGVYVLRFGVWLGDLGTKVKKARGAFNCRVTKTMMCQIPRHNVDGMI